VDQELRQYSQQSRLAKNAHLSAFALSLQKSRTG
jgi:hypothetical protein